MASVARQEEESGSRVEGTEAKVQEITQRSP